MFRTERAKIADDLEAGKPFPCIKSREPQACAGALIVLRNCNKLSGSIADALGNGFSPDALSPDAQVCGSIDEFVAGGQYFTLRD
jgi:hypothetical protein